MYTYAFFKTSGAPVPVREGISGEVEVVGTSSLSALVEPGFDFDEIEQNDNQLVQAVLTHDRVICDLFWEMTILPLRFGTHFVSQERLIEHLEANQETYLAKLNQLEGKAEYRLKFTPIEQTVDLSLNGSLKGKEHLHAKNQRYRSQSGQQTQQRQELRQVIHEIAQSYPNYIISEAKDGIEKLYLLIEQKEEKTLYEKLHQWQEQCPTWELALGEALPPYHFV